jgi:hypothetical protein
VTGVRREEPPPPYRKGDAVLYLAGSDLWGQERAFPGRIARITHSGEYVVQFDGGHKRYSTRATANQLRPIGPVTAQSPSSP